MTSDKRYPYRFLNSDFKEVARISKQVSHNGVPRYSVNPKCLDNTYDLHYCLQHWIPIYKYKVGDIVKWKDYTLEVIKVRLKDELVQCKGVNNGVKTISWKHWLNFEDITLT